MKKQLVIFRNRNPLSTLDFSYAECSSGGSGGWHQRFMEIIVELYKKKER